VQSATLDGEPLDRSWITGRELHRAGHLVLELAPEPSGWGAGHRPPSGPSSPHLFGLADAASVGGVVRGHR
jgi:putative alpha-1,2-mannosidase